MGRPPVPFNQELADFICEKIATTDMGMEQVLEEWKAEHGSVISLTVLYRWRKENKQFSEDSARARMMQAELLHDRAQLAATTPLMGEIVEESDKFGRKVKRMDNVQRSQLIVQTLLKRAGQLDHERYGDKVKVENSNDPLVDLLSEMRDEYTSISKEDIEEKS